MFRRKNFLRVSIFFRRNHGGAPSSPRRCHPVPPPGVANWRPKMQCPPHQFSPTPRCVRHCIHGCGLRIIVWLVCTCLHLKDFPVFLRGNHRASLRPRRWHPPPATQSSEFSTEIAAPPAPIVAWYFDEMLILLFANSCIRSAPNRACIRICGGRQYPRLGLVWCFLFLSHVCHSLSAQESVLRLEYCHFVALFRCRLACGSFTVNVRRMFHFLRFSPPSHEKNVRSKAVPKWKCPAVIFLNLTTPSHLKKLSPRTLSVNDRFDSETTEIVIYAKERSGGEEKIRNVALYVFTLGHKLWTIRVRVREGGWNWAYRLKSIRK